MQSQETKASFASFYEQALKDLQQHYGDVITRPVYHGGTEATEQRVIGQIAILVKQQATDELLGWANRWNSDHYPTAAMHIQLTGPWPAYTFCPSLSDSTAISEAA